MVHYKLKDVILQFLVLLMAFSAIFACKEFVGPTYSGRIHYIVFPLALMWGIAANAKIAMEAKLYIAALCFGFFLHSVSGVAENDKIQGTLFARLAPVYILGAYVYASKPYKRITQAALAFFIAECLISFYERITITHLITYANEMGTNATSVLMSTTENFRSFALMFHPLYNANTVSIAMGFIMCSNKMNPVYKFILIALGLAAIWGCNSRGVTIVWAIIFIYRLAFYNRKWWQTALVVVPLYFLLPALVDLITYSDLFGRMQNIDFSEESAMTRFIALDIFTSARWNLQEVIVGGRLLTYWGSTTTLENGVLLDISYWGWIVGPIKVASEMYLTWHASNNFPNRARLIIMLATWGLAFLNNNSQQTWLLPIFVFFCIAFSPFQDKNGQPIKEDHTRLDFADIRNEKQTIPPELL